jgi:hypothetical protein
MGIIHIVILTAPYRRMYTSLLERLDLDKSQWLHKLSIIYEFIGSVSVLYPD